VGVCLERSIDLLIAPLAIFKAGGAYLPLDSDHPDHHIASIVESARLEILIGRSDLTARLPEFSGRLVLVDWDALEKYPKVNQPVEVLGSDLAYVIYTSGSTGQPKGVMIPRRALNNLLWSVRDWFQFGPRDVLLALTTIAFDIAGVDVWLPLLVGARMLMVERATAMDAQLLQDIIHREGVTFMQGTPAVWRLLVNSGWEGKADLQAVCTGEAMPLGLVGKLFPKVGRLWNMYGPTETTIWSTGYKFLSPDDPVLIGRPVANTQIYILDENLTPTPIGVPGELYIGGDGLADGYLHKPELTADRFVADPFSKRSGGRLYKTGDLARYRGDGNIECLGRNDHQIKLRGFRIEPEEIHAAITQHPAIRDAIAVLKTSATGDSRIVAYLISQTNNPPDATELRNFLRRKLPEYMIPASFVFLHSFPLNSNGKIDRQALPEPKVLSPESAASQAPADQIEAQLRDIYRAVLGLSAIGVNDDFFDLGGHSLMAAQLFRRINVCFNIDLPLATLFHASTVRGLAALIRDSAVEQMNAPIVQIQDSGSLPPLYCIGDVTGELIVFRRLALELGLDQPLYGLQPFRVQGSLTTLEQLAAAYLDEIRKTGESRPFCLMGYCFGGLVAVEMAHQLQRNGNAAPMVVLIDGAYPAGCRASEPWTQRVRRYRSFWRQVTNGGGWSHFRGRVKYGFARIAHRASSKAGVSLASGANDVSTMQGLAYESYRIKSYNGRVHLFRAESRHEFLTGGPELGWCGVLSNLVVEEVPGDHATINTGANLKILAGKVKQCLRDPLANGLPRA
jgi:amino acid adenylation domain-containing protein